jgi:hypothetical protein
MKLRLLALVVFAALVGCTSNQVLVTLEASVAATETLVASLAANGEIPAETAYEISTAIAGLPTAFQQTKAELDTTDSAALKSTKIALLYIPTLQAIDSLPPGARAYAVAISAAIQSFLKAITPATTGLQASPTSPAIDIGSYKHLDDRIFELTDKIGLMQKR